MKQLDNLDDKVPFPAEFEQDDDIKSPEDLQKRRDTMPTYRRLLRLVCMNVRAKSIAEADACDQIRLKLMQSDGNILVEDNEFEMLMTRVKDNPLDWQNYMFSRAMGYLREAEKKKVEVVAK